MDIFTNIINKLKRDTGKNKFIPVIDGLRTLALFPVILMHFNTNYKRYLGQSISQEYDRIINNGDRGVLLFFAISGFILTLGFYNIFIKGDKINYKDYFMRRLTRLEPPFVISTLLLFFIVQVSFKGGWEELLYHLGATLTYTHNIIYGYWSPINPVTWSLELEIQFYIFLPILCLLLFKISSLSRNILLISMIIILPFLFISPGSFLIQNLHFKRSLPVYFSHFIVGVLFLNIYASNFWKSMKESYFWDLIGLVSIILFFIVDFGENRAYEAIILDLIILLIFISTFKSLFLKRLFSTNFIVIFGGMCYSIYLIHYPIIYGISKISKFIIFDNNNLNYLFHFLITFVFVLIITSFFYLMFEKPFMKRNWWKKKRV